MHQKRKHIRVALSGEDLELFNNVRSSMINTYNRIKQSHPEVDMPQPSVTDALVVRYAIASFAESASSRDTIYTLTSLLIDAANIVGPLIDMKHANDNDLLKEAESIYSKLDKFLSGESK